MKKLELPFSFQGGTSLNRKANSKDMDGWSSCCLVCSHDEHISEVFWIADCVLVIRMQVFARVRYFPAVHVVNRIAKIIYVLRFI
jgi:hypothetical protein